MGCCMSLPSSPSELRSGEDIMGSGEVLMIGIGKG
jgi:hypothetical protein